MHMGRRNGIEPFYTPDGGNAGYQSLALEAGQIPVYRRQMSGCSVFSISYTISAEGWQWVLCRQARMALRFLNCFAAASIDTSCLICN